MSSKKETISNLLGRKGGSLGASGNDSASSLPVNTATQETVPAVAKKKKATFDLDGDLHTQLKIYAAKKDKPMVDIVEAALRQYFIDNDDN